MILAQSGLRAAVAAGEIRFEPGLEERQWSPASIDLRLGTQFTMLRRAPGIKIALTSDLGQLGAALWKTMDLPLENELGKRNTLCLEPDEFVLAMTYERISVPRNPR